MSDFRDVIAAEIEKARRTMSEAKAKYDTLVSMLAKYEESRNSSNGSKPKPAVTAPSAVSLAPSTFTDADESKADRLRRVVVENQSTGMKAAAILKALNSDGVEINRAYVYSILARLKKRGEVRTKNGKYYPTPAMTSSTQDTQQSPASQAETP